MSDPRSEPRLRRHLRAGFPALVVVALFITWAIQDGGFDTSTWYWGALILLATFAAVIVGVLRGRLRVSGSSAIALSLLTAYVAWSYVSMAWAQYPGLALEGSNRALLYLLVFATMAVLPWTRETSLAALLLFAVGIGVIAVVLLARLASGGNVDVLFVGGRLAAPTGYINSTAALFTSNALVSIVLAARRRLPGPLRGLLLAFAGASLQLAVIVESRGWLFTLPLVALVAIVLVPDRLRVAGATVIPVLAALIPIRGLLRVYQTTPGPGLGGAAAHAARPALMILAAAFLSGTLLAWADGLYRGPGLTAGVRRVIGVGLVIIAVAGVGAGGLVVSKGDPLGFISRQWSGFSHEQSNFGGSHFTDVGSGRYDFWRVALDAFVAHPIGGLGQDNFGDYYLPRGRTGEEPSWTHSLELRLLTHTGAVGFALFAGFLVFAIAAALRPRRRGDAATRLLSATLLLPLVVWLVHGSLDWFWEVPALAGPALGFLGAGAGLGSSLEPGAAPAGRGVRLRVPAPAAGALAAIALVCVTAVLAFPFLSARQVSLALTAQATDPTAALRDLRRAGQLDPLSSDPGRIAGAVALRAHAYAVAQQRFRQSIAAEPGGWFSWLGAGLAASALGQRERARHDYRVAAAIDDHQPAVAQALQRIDSRAPLTSDEAFRLLQVVQ